MEDSILTLGRMFIRRLRREARRSVPPRTRGGAHADKCIQCPLIHPLTLQWFDPIASLTGISFPALLAFRFRRIFVNFQFAKERHSFMPTVPITVAHGDGIGPEIMEATLFILKEAGAKLDIQRIDIGEKVYLAGNTSGSSRARGIRCAARGSFSKLRSPRRRAAASRV